MNDYFQSFFYLSILFNILFYIKSDFITSKNECLENECFKKIINKKGLVENDCVNDPDSVNKSIYKSLKYNDTFIIFDCVRDEEKESECINSTQDEYDLSPSTCKRKNTKDKENICCYYREKRKKTNEFNFSCIEINQNEIERFRSIHINKEVIENNENNIIGEIECDSRLYKMNKLFIFVFLFILYQI